jgi:hypothetical protein
VLRSPGQPLEPGLRGEMESRFGHDFSRVRVHTGDRAAESARAVDARAYTVGSHVVFGGSGYAAGAPESRALLGHELVHVTQQGASAHVPSHLEVGRVDDPAESDARRMATAEGSPTAEAPKLRRQPRFGPDCTEFHRCKVIEPLVHARQMVDSALAELAPVASGTVTSGRIVDLLNVHFHNPGAVGPTATTVLAKLTTLRSELDAPITYVCHQDRPPDCEVTPTGFVGGFTDLVPGADVHLCDLYFISLPCTEEARVLVHEAAHHLGGVGDRAYVADPAYDSLSANEALTNADTYAQFAKMVFRGAPSCVDCGEELQRRGGRRYPASATPGAGSQQQVRVTPGDVRVSREAAPPAPSTGDLDPEMLRQISRALRQAMEGLGTDESAIYAAFSGRTQDQVEAIARVYADMYQRDLMADLRDELSESELQHLGTFAPQHPAGSPEATSPAETARLADVVAQQLDDAMRGLGTDETAIYAALTGRTATERQAIKDAYQRRTHRTLESDLRDEMSGSELVRALALLNQGMLAPEDELYLAMEGLGTDEDTIFRVLDGMAGNTTAINAMESAYRDKYGDLIDDLRGDLSDEEYAHAMRVLRPVLQDVSFDDCSRTIIPQIRALIPVGIAKVEHAISVLARGWAGMSAAEQSVFNQFFDPSGSGVDESFVRDVLANFRKIRREFDDDLGVECETGGGLCTGGRLYYTYWRHIHVCPYFQTETNQTRKERDFVHELTHNALVAVDRPYYETQRAAYNQMTPRGPWTRGIPFFGPLFTFISRSDTLNSPDAYAFFAFNV